MYVRNDGQRRMRELFTSGKRNNLIYGGSRSGKTFETVGTIIERSLFAEQSRHLITRQEGTSAKRAIVKGTFPEVVKLRWPGLKTTWREKYGYFEIENGSEIWVSGLNDEKALEKVLGNEYASIYMNEASENRYSSYTLLRSRLAQTANTIEGDQLSQRMYVDLNPTTRQHWTYRLWRDGVDPDTDLPIDMSGYGYVVVNPKDNAANLSKEYLAELEKLPPAAKKRFFDGEYVADAEHALWRRETIHRTQNPPDLVRIVVAVDPATSNEPGSDETGIIAAGVDAGGNGYLLADESGKYRPEEWARKAVALYLMYDADRIVAEKNQGGDMVESTIRTVNPDVPYKSVHASRGKYTRAEPIAALYESGRVYHAGEFASLEDQMCSFTTDMDRKASGFSPDRVDALVWGFTDLFPNLTKRRKKEQNYDIPQAFSHFS